MPTAQQLKDRFAGCLVGQCLGDALGLLVEGMPPHVCREYVDRALRPQRIPRTGRGPFPFGQYSDDSQLARELMQSYVACRRFDPQDYAARIAAIFRENRIVGRGRATEAAARRLIQGVPWDQAGEPPPSAGNGSAMRAGPIGLLFFDAPRRLVQAAIDQGRITHQDPRCSAGAVAIAGAVSIALQSDTIDAPHVVAQLTDWIRPVEPEFAWHLEQLEDWLALSPDEAVQPISEAGLDPGHRDFWQGISPFVIGSVLWSLYSFLRTPSDYWETICTAIAVGGDVDTTAAMAGAISGAHLGLAPLPQPFVERITDQGTWGLAELTELAHRCVETKTQPD